MLKELLVETEKKAKTSKLHNLNIMFEGDNPQCS